MKKSGIIAILALLVAVAGLVLAVAAYLKKKNCLASDDFEEEMMDDDNEYFAAQYDQTDEPQAAAPADDLTQDIEDHDPSIEE